MAEKKRPHIDNENCAGCSVCIENCPKDCLSLTEPQFKGDIHTVATMVNPDECISCGICERLCPISAIVML